MKKCPEFKKKKERGKGSKSKAWVRQIEETKDRKQIKIEKSTWQNRRIRKTVKRKKRGEQDRRPKALRT